MPGTVQPGNAAQAKMAATQIGHIKVGQHQTPPLWELFYRVQEIREVYAGKPQKPAHRAQGFVADKISPHILQH